MSALPDSPADARTGLHDAAGVEVDAPATPAPRVERPNSPADRFMRRLLRIPDDRTSTADEARSAFQKSLVLSAFRCLLMYILFPFVLPAIGIAKGVGPAIGLAIGILAIVSIVYSIRRFWRADHSKRWHYTAFGSAIIAFLLYSSVRDVVDLFG